MAVLLSAICLLASQPLADAAERVPIKIQAVLIAKLLVFNKGISDGGHISIYVIGAPEFAAEMKKAVGKKIGKSRLVAITEGTSLPSSWKPSVIYLGDASMVEEVIAYTRSNKLLSITGISELVSKGITLGLGVSDKKPKILLNLLSSKKEDISWHPTIFKISTIVK
jgi:hypothetical protein